MVLGAAATGENGAMEGLNLTVVAVMGATLFVYSLVSDRLERWNITAPIVFVAVGYLVANGPTQFVHQANWEKDLGQ